MNRNPLLRRVGMVMLAIAGMLVTQGCVGPKFINSSTGRQDTVKFVYVQQKMFNVEQGVLKCKVSADGNLNDCKKLKIVFEEK